MASCLPTLLIKFKFQNILLLSSLPYDEEVITGTAEILTHDSGDVVMICLVRCWALLRLSTTVFYQWLYYSLILHHTDWLASLFIVNNPSFPIFEWRISPFLVHPSHLVYCFCMCYEIAASNKSWKFVDCWRGCHRFFVVLWLLLASCVLLFVQILCHWACH